LANEIVAFTRYRDVRDFIAGIVSDLTRRIDNFLTLYGKEVKIIMHSTASIIINFK
jgi:hypothetical protein